MCRTSAPNASRIPPSGLFLLSIQLITNYESIYSGQLLHNNIHISQHCPIRGLVCSVCLSFFACIIKMRPSTSTNLPTTVESAPEHAPPHQRRIMVHLFRYLHKLGILVAHVRLSCAYETFFAAASRTCAYSRSTGWHTSHQYRASKSVSIRLPVVRWHLRWAPVPVASSIVHSHFIIIIILFYYF